MSLAGMDRTIYEMSLSSTRMSHLEPGHSNASTMIEEGILETRPEESVVYFRGTEFVTPKICLFVDIDYIRLVNFNK